MYNIIVNAYACAPNMGSEPGMAWNWIINLAKYCTLHVITEGEWRSEIEETLKELPQGKNIKFYYNPVSSEIRNMCWNQGDWRFYKYYKTWQYQTYEMALDIVAKEKIDILHQLNMIGFREPGYLWKIENIPFVWGPIGGLKQFPLAYLQGAGIKAKLFNRLKNTINILQLKYHQRVNAALSKASVLVSSIPDSYFALKKYKHIDSVIIPETGCFLSHDLPLTRFHNKEFHLMWVGKFDFRKQLPLALKSIAACNNPQLVLDVYGSGTSEQESEAKQIVQELNISEQVVFHGNCPNDVVISEMQKAQLFFFTSVSEDTSTVVLEAISNRLPVLCFNACGFGHVIDATVGRKVPLSTPEQSVAYFAKEINELCSHREILQELSTNSKEHQQKFSWENKVQQMVELYRQAVKK